MEKEIEMKTHGSRTDDPSAWGKGKGAMKMEETDATVTTEAEKAESGTARARRIVTGPMAELGRPRKVSEAQHRDNLDRLARKLSYMDEAPLLGLAELVLGHAGQVAVSGAKVPVCPSDAMVLAWGFALQAPPIGQSDYPASVIRSVMGRRAQDGGYAVELLRHARRFGPPPGSYSVLKLQEEAQANRHRRRALRAEIDMGNSLTPDQRRWLDAYHADAETVERLISEGDERRAGREGQAA